MALEGHPQVSAVVNIDRSVKLEVLPTSLFIRVEGDGLGTKQRARSVVATSIDIQRVGARISVHVV